jgi:hypothetical protein
MKDKNLLKSKDLIIMNRQILISIHFKYSVKFPLGLSFFLQIDKNFEEVFIHKIF